MTTPEIQSNILLDVDFYLKAAAQHGLDEDPDHEVGDLQSLLRAAWSVMTSEQRGQFALSDEVKSCVEAAIFVDYNEDYVDEQNSIKENFMAFVIDGNPERFCGIEVSGVRFETDSDITTDNDNPEFFSVYLKREKGGVECVADFVCPMDAVQFAEQAGGKYGLLIDNKIKPEILEDDAPARSRPKM